MKYVECILKILERSTSTPLWFSSSYPNPQTLELAEHTTNCYCSCSFLCSCSWSCSSSGTPVPALFVFLTFLFFYSSTKINHTWLKENVGPIWRSFCRIPMALLSALSFIDPPSAISSPLPCFIIPISWKAVFYKPYHLFLANLANPGAALQRPS